MKKSAAILIIVGILIWITQISGCVKSNYQFEKKYLYSWNLSDKSSTIEAKALYIDQFVNTLANNKEYFSDYNAIWLKTPDNSIEYNLKAIQTLKDRLIEIKGMDVSSFQYNTAIQQITSQEQGEASKLTSVIQGCYDLKNYWYVWNWIGTIVMLTGFISLIIGLVLTGVLNYL